MSERIGIFASRTTSTAQVETSPNLRNDENGEALYIAVDITAGTPAMLVTINAYDETSRKSIALLTSASLNAVGTTLLKVGPQLTAGANVAKEYLPYEFNVSVSGGAAGTYSIGGWIT